MEQLSNDSLMEQLGNDSLIEEPTAGSATIH